jgi:hypothetical protein
MGRIFERLVFAEHYLNNSRIFDTCSISKGVVSFVHTPACSSLPTLIFTYPPTFELSTTTEVTKCHKTIWIFSLAFVSILRVSSTSRQMMYSAMERMGTVT